MTWFRWTIDNISENGSALLNQQCWCWGRDILRPDGNWLLENGFERLEPPDDLEDCSSIYRLSLPGNAIIILRGFGVFFGQRGLGGVFLPRFEFKPRYAKSETLKCPPWTDDGFQELAHPSTADRNKCGSLVLKLIDWIREYEVNVCNRLGLNYRQHTLTQWDNGKRIVVPAERFAADWRRLSLQIAANLDGFLLFHPGNGKR